MLLIIIFMFKFAVISNYLSTFNLLQKMGNFWTSMIEKCDSVKAGIANLYDLQLEIFADYQIFYLFALFKLINLGCDSKLFQ